MRTVLKKAKKDATNQTIDLIRQASQSHDTKNMWNHIHSLSKFRPKTHQALRKADGTYCHTAEDTAEVIQTYLTNTLGALSTPLSIPEISTLDATLADQPSMISPLYRTGRYPCHAQTIDTQICPHMVIANSTLAVLTRCGCISPLQSLEHASISCPPSQVLENTSDCVDQQTPKMPVYYIQPTPSQPIRPCVQSLPIQPAKTGRERPRDSRMEPHHVWRTQREIHCTGYSHCPVLNHTKQQERLAIRGLFWGRNQGLRSTPQTQNRACSQDKNHRPYTERRAAESHLRMPLYNHSRRHRGHSDYHSRGSSRRPTWPVLVCPHIRRTATRPRSLLSHFSRLCLPSPSMGTGSLPSTRHPPYSVSPSSCIHRRLYPILHIHQSKKTGPRGSLQHQTQEKMGSGRQPVQGSANHQPYHRQMQEEVLSRRGQNSLSNYISHGGQERQIFGLVCQFAWRLHGSSGVQARTGTHSIPSTASCALHEKPHYPTKTARLSVSGHVYTFVRPGCTCDYDPRTQKTRISPKQTSPRNPQTSCIYLSRHQHGNTRHDQRNRGALTTTHQQASAVQKDGEKSPGVSCSICGSLGQSCQSGGEAPSCSMGTTASQGCVARILHTGCRPSPYRHTRCSGKVVLAHQQGKDQNAFVYNLSSGPQKTSSNSTRSPSASVRHVLLLHTFQQVVSFALCYETQLSQPGQSAYHVSTMPSVRKTFCFPVQNTAALSKKVHTSSSRIHHSKTIMHCPSSDFGPSRHLHSTHTSPVLLSETLPLQCRPRLTVAETAPSPTQPEPISPK